MRLLRCLGKEGRFTCQHLLLEETLRAESRLDWVTGKMIEQFQYYDVHHDLSQVLQMGLGVRQVPMIPFHVVRGPVPAFVRREDGTPYPVQEMLSIGLCEPLAALAEPACRCRSGS